MTPVFVITLSDIISLVFFVCMFLGVAIWALSDWLRQWKCRHDSFYENMACNAICRQCNKNLGFIGTVREQREKVKNNGSKS